MKNTNTIRVQQPVDQGNENFYRLRINQLLDIRPTPKAKPTNPVVALDIDGVIADFNAALKPLSKKAGLKETCPSHYDFVASNWFDTWEDFDKAHCKVMDTASTIPLLDNTVAPAVNKLQAEGIKVISVTARRGIWRKETEKFFNNHNINIGSDELFFVDSSNKTNIHYDFLLDDSLKNIVDTLENSQALPVVRDQRYNRGVSTHRVNTVMGFANQVLETLG